MLEEFLAADVVVIGAPMYNFTVPSQLKAWIDRILVAGKTFKYGPTGVEGLAHGKRVIIAVSRGGFYGADTPMAVGEHLESYLRFVFGFIASPIRRSSRQTASKSAPNIAKKQSPRRYPRPPA